MLLAAKDALVGRRNLLREDVGVEAPAARVVEVRIAVLEAGKRRPFRLVDLRTVRPAREERHRRCARLERFSRVVERRGSGAEDADALAFERGEVDGIGGVKYISSFP